jgi:hypothetical protein
MLELTQVTYPDLVDLAGVSASDLAQLDMSLLTNVMLPQGKAFKPNSAVSRFEVAEAFVRAGRVPQYTASKPMYTDVNGVAQRNAVESVQSNPGGRLFYDVTAGGKFYPYSSAERLIAAIAFVKSAGLEGAAASAVLPQSVSDAASIPAAWRGYAAVALQKGFIQLDGNQFAPTRALTRLELAIALNKLINN